MPSFHGDHFDGGPCAAEYSIAPEQIQPSCSRTDETGTLFIRITRKALPKKDYRPSDVPRECGLMKVGVR